MKFLIKNISILATLLFLNSSFCFAMESSCAICYDNAHINVQLIPCGHVFCYDCMKKHHKALLRENINRTYNFLQPNCPLCRTQFEKVQAIGNDECQNIKPLAL